MKAQSKTVALLAAWVSALLCAVAVPARADWTPPESSVTPPAVLTLDAFTAADGYPAYAYGPFAPLVTGPDGALYGSTFSGGANRYQDSSYGCGTLFRLANDGTFTTLHDFSGADGALPTAALIVGPDGALYGSTPEIWSDMAYWLDSYGTLFRVETNGTFTKLHDFNGPDGFGTGGLEVGPDGALYGSSRNGGTGSSLYGDGTLFRLQTNGIFSKLHDFRGPDGNGPSALVLGPDGAL